MRSNRRRSRRLLPRPRSIDDTMEAGEGDSPRRRMVGFNEYEGPFGTHTFRWRLSVRLRCLRPGCKQQGAVPGSLARMEDTGLANPVSRKFQDQTADQLERRRHVRLGRREVGDAADARDHRGPGNLGAYRRWPYQRRFLDEQGHDRIWGLDHGAPTDQRRDPSHPR